jgi:hypothetical protein|uniref:START domain-containing protein n=1 Tax=Globisporangium ultimum (strain ATCC 200006 / CBS 805.95 / DAOM BR144) TaxID=431595 RepID=K3WT67_GLOUD
MVLNSGVEVAHGVVDSVKMATIENQEAKQEAVRTLAIPAPITTVRACLEEFENDSINRLLVRYAGADVLPNGWRDGPENKGIKVVYGQVDGSDWFTMRTVGKLRVSAAKAAQILVAADMVPKFDEMTKEVRLLERLSEATEVRVVSAKSVMFTSARDFCVATTVRKEASGRIVIATRSVDHPQGNQKGYVRALIHISGYIVTPDPHDPNACELAVIAHMDLGGNMPAMVVRYLGLSAPIKLVQKIDEVTYSTKL